MVTLKEAKDLYKKHRCSLFGVFRDEGPECESFLREKVSQTVRRQWAEECFDEFMLEFEHNPDCSYGYHAISSVLHVHHDEALFDKFTSMLKRMTLSPMLKFQVCDDILGMRNLRSKVGLLDYAWDDKNREAFDFMLAFVHEYLNNPVEIPEGRTSRYEAMKEVAAEYDKIQTRGL